MKISILVEGETERAFLPHLRAFLKIRVSGQIPRLDMYVYNGRIAKQQKLRRTVEALLRNGSDAVIALTDVYTGTSDFIDAADAKSKMRQWVGQNDRFFPHAAQYDFEAWLLPYWAEIQKLAKHNRTVPSNRPESVNHNHPPSWHIQEIFRTGQGSTRQYVKARDAKRILRDQDLAEAAAVCPELKAFPNTIIVLSKGNPI